MALLLPDSMIIPRGKVDLECHPPRVASRKFLVAKFFRSWASAVRVSSTVSTDKSKPVNIRQGLDGTCDDHFLLEKREYVVHLDLGLLDDSDAESSTSVSSDGSSSTALYSQEECSLPDYEFEFDQRYPSTPPFSSSKKKPMVSPFGLWRSVGNRGEESAASTTASSSASSFSSGSSRSCQSPPTRSRLTADSVAVLLTV